MYMLKVLVTLVNNCPAPTLVCSSLPAHYKYYVISQYIAFNGKTFRRSIELLLLP